jgi:hypothetical protein
MSRFGKGLKTVSSASCTGGKNKSNDVQKEKSKKEKKQSKSKKILINGKF